MLFGDLTWPPLSLVLFLLPPLIVMSSSTLPEERTRLRIDAYVSILLLLTGKLGLRSRPMQRKGHDLNIPLTPPSIPHTVTGLLDSALELSISIVATCACSGRRLDPRSLNSSVEYIFNLRLKNCLLLLVLGPVPTQLIYDDTGPLGGSFLLSIVIFSRDVASGGLGSAMGL